MVEEEGQSPQVQEPTIETAPQGRAPASAPMLHPAPDPQTKFSTTVSEGESIAPFGETNTGTSIPLDTYSQKLEQDSGWQADHGPRPSRWNVFTGSASQAMSDSLGGSLLRLWQQRSLPDDTVPISADQANKLFPERETPYTTPVDPRIVGMEQGRAAGRQEQDEWLSQAPSGFLTGASRLAGGLAGGFLSPENIVVGALSGGIADLLTPEAAPALGKIAIKYLSEWGGFTEQAALTNYVEHQMGARKQDLTEVAAEQAGPAAIGTSLHVALGALARKFADVHAEDLTADNLKKGIVAIERGENLPSFEDSSHVAEARNNGLRVIQGGKFLEPPPAIPTPLAESKLYVGVHSEGTAHVFEHGLGEGTQFTDTHDAANHGVAHDNVPGQVAETKLAEGSKLLDIEKPIKEDLASENSFIKAIEEKTGIKIAQNPSLEDASLKEVIQQLGDSAGSHGIPEDILQQVQGIAKEHGYSGYELSNGPGSSVRTAHIFDPSEQTLSSAHQADPTLTPPVPKDAVNGVPPSEDDIKKSQKNYSPQIEQMLRDEHSKSERFQQYTPKALADAQLELEGYKKQLTELAKSGEAAQPKKLINDVNDMMGVANRVEAVPKEDIVLKNGTSLKMGVEMMEHAHKGASGRKLQINAPTIVARLPDGTVAGIVQMGGGFRLDTGEFQIRPSMVEVPEEYHRQGIASAMYDYGNKYVAEMNRSDINTEAGSKFRDAYDANKEKERPPVGAPNTAKEMLDALRQQEAQDARLRDVANRIAECGSGGGV